MWMVWLLGSVVLVIAGFSAAFVPRARASARSAEVARSTALAAIDSAAITRDAGNWYCPEAERLLARAELLMANRGGTASARVAADCARRAERLWRGSFHG
ncbi:MULTISPECIES: DUF6403 family protein [Actinosynnema]|uniref:DUF6403 family protein n=1 Tax=Actinosynnema TaxID=40566 RepID=UPI0020A4B81B|nr:DUF6403 family protein [Actinosynnema pretiosum]MCP2099050.1 hypothetical protein [Actinosynnema pretiosum]